MATKRSDLSSKFLPTKTQQKHVAPTVEKDTISVTQLFKQRGGDKKTMEARARKPLGPFRHTVNSRTVKKPNVKSQKTSVRVLKKKKQPDMHPLAVAFQDTTKDYRRHLYEQTSLRINETLQSLLATIHKASHQTPASPPSPSEAANKTYQLTIPEKYDFKVKTLCRPLSSYAVRTTSTNSSAAQEKSTMTFGKYMEDFDDYFRKETKEIAALQSKWETIIGEIFKIGIDLVGEVTMQDLFFDPSQEADTEEEELEQALTRSKTNPEFPLFVREHGTSLPKTRPSGKKRVTFQSPLANTKSKHLDFLYQPSIYRNKPLPQPPVLPTTEVEELQGLVEDLGQKEIEDMTAIEKDYQAWWQKKTAKIAMALGDD